MLHFGRETFAEVTFIPCFPSIGISLRTGLLSIQIQMTNSNLFPIGRQYTFNVYRVAPKTQQQRQQLSLFYVHRHPRGKRGGRERRLSGWHHHSLYSIPVNNTTRKTRRRRDATKIYLSYTNHKPTWISFIPVAVHKAKLKTFSHSLRVCVHRCGKLRGHKLN